MNKFLQDIQNHRHTIKKYDATRPVADADWNEIKEFMHHAPHSMNHQQVRLIAVDRNTEIGAKLADQSMMMFNNVLMGSVAKTVFFITPQDKEGVSIDDPAFIDGTIHGALRGVKNPTKEQLDGALAGTMGAFQGMGFTNYGVWATRQAYIYLGYMEVAAAALGLDTTPMEGIVPANLKKMFVEAGLMTEAEQVVLAQGLGYRFDDTTFNPAPRKPMDWFVTEVK